MYDSGFDRIGSGRVGEFDFFTAITGRDRQRQDAAAYKGEENQQQNERSFHNDYFCFISSPMRYRSPKELNVPF